ncbi:hypothetical protein AAFP35_18060 [Gordonia sp. CPCC 206044]|uniref:hypothetical protein n=1 Tax=Gordonia sp. CPCC 206044 TaxID=3140793 RepID=UPI003AF3ECB3
MVQAVDFGWELVHLRPLGRPADREGPIVIGFEETTGSDEFQIIDQPRIDRATLVPDLELVDDSACEAAYRRVEHLMEIMTGYRSGDPANARRGEPRASYTAGKSMEERFVAKAAELGVGRSTVQGWMTNFLASGMNPASQLDGRSTKRRLGWRRNTHPGWVACVRDSIREHIEEQTSSVRRETIRREADENFKRQFPGEKAPGRSVAFEVIADLATGTYLFDSPDAAEQVAHRDTQLRGGLHASYPTQLMLIDTHHIDVIGIDRLSGRYVPLQLTLLLDVFSKKVPAFVLSEISTDSFVVAQLLYRYFCPQARPPYMQKLGFLGVPRRIVADEDKAEFLTARRPVISTLIPDNDKVFIGRSTTAALINMGTTLRPARVRTPGDKGPCERIFETIEFELFVHEPGYRGSSTVKRGKNIENKACRTVDDLERELCEFFEKYHRAVHSGLRLPDVPQRTLTPNQMHCVGAIRSFGKLGLSVPADPDAALRLLRVEWRVITHKGVAYKHQFYKCSEQDSHRAPKPGDKSNLGSGRNRGKWPIRVNPWDMRHIKLECGPGEWITLTWVKAHLVDGPFTERTLEIALQVTEDDPGVIDIVQAINEILHRYGAGLADTPEERRAAIEEIRREYANMHELGRPPDPHDEQDYRRSPSDTDLDSGDDDESSLHLEDIIDEDSDRDAEDAPESTPAELADYYARASGSISENTWSTTT